MKSIDARAGAAAAVAADPARPATAILHDTADLRLVVFRLRAGQSVPPHRSPSTVMLTVIAGRGTVSGGDAERAVSQGDVVVYEPNEVHGMRAEDGEFQLLASITPRPGGRA